MPYLDSVFIIIFGVYLYWVWGLLRALKSDAPFVPMKPDVVKALVAAVEPTPGGLWVDLGSGDGRVLVEVCSRYAMRGTGIERIRALRWLSRLVIWRSGLGRRIQIRKGDFFKADLSEASVVSFYLLPETHRRVWEKLRREARPGTQLVVHRFPIQDVPAISENQAFQIYHYRVPG